MRAPAVKRATMTVRGDGGQSLWDQRERSERLVGVCRIKTNFLYDSFQSQLR